MSTLPACRSPWKRAVDQRVLEHALDREAQRACRPSQARRNVAGGLVVADAGHALHHQHALGRPARGRGAGCHTSRGRRRASAAPSSTMFSASSRKSSSSSASWANSSTKPGRLATRTPSCRPVRRRRRPGRAPRRRMSAKRLRSPGRRTLTTTSVPSCSVARWTCAIDAAANGARSSKIARRRSPMLPLDRLHREVAGERVHIVAAPGERLDPLVRQQPVGGRDELSELHVGGPAGADQLLGLRDTERVAARRHGEAERAGGGGQDRERRVGRGRARHPPAGGRQRRDGVVPDPRAREAGCLALEAAAHSGKLALPRRGGSGQTVAACHPRGIRDQPPEVRGEEEPRQTPSFDVTPVDVTSCPPADSSPA